jgi:hypothetical protein
VHGAYARTGRSGPLNKFDRAETAPSFCARECPNIAVIAELLAACARRRRRVLATVDGSVSPHPCSQKDASDAQVVLARFDGTW